MSLKLDLEARRLTASVGDLVEEGGGRVIGFSGSGMSRLWIGQELHRRVQIAAAAAEDGYRAEVPVSTDLEVDGFTVTLVGRADGVLFADGRALRVDEVKTLHFAVDLHHLYADERLERFRQQGRLYAFMLSGGGPPAALRLVLVDIVTGEELTEEVEWSEASVAAWLRQKVHRLVAAERRRLERAAALRATAERLPFPHPCVRPAQEVMGEAVRSSLGADRHLLLTAPTGSGKTAPVLHEALRRSLETGRRLWVLSAKTLQQRQAVATLRAMQGSGFRSLQLRAKSKMCANTEIICHEEYCPYAREYALKLARSGVLGQALAAADHVDPDELFTFARGLEVCPFETSLDLMPDMDVVVCDYNYVFDPGIGLDAMLERRALEQAILVIDEAHNLVDRGRGYYSPALDRSLLARALAYLESRSTPVFRRLALLLEDLDDLIRRTVEEALGPRPGDALVELPEGALADLRLELDGALLQYFMYKRENDLWTADDPVVHAFLALTRLHRVLALEGEEFVHLATRDENGERLRIVCRDASRFIGAVLDRAAGVVAMSATLEPFAFYRDLLGFDPDRTDTVRLPSPFPPENRLVLAIPEVDTSFRKRQHHMDAIAGWVGRLAHPEKNVLALFPSYRFLAAVRDRLPPVRHRVLVQEPGSSDQLHHQVLGALSAQDRPALLLAVLGGVFAEGVDYPGEMLSEVIVVSPGLPQLNAERELLKAYYEERYGRGFLYAYLVPGLMRVTQAAGRLIRSPEDRGVIALLCRRFVQAPYFGLLPEEWSGGEPEVLLHPDPEGAVAAFFAGNGGGR